MEQESKVLLDNLTNYFNTFVNENKTPNMDFVKTLDKVMKKIQEESEKLKEKNRQNQIDELSEKEKEILNKLEDYFNDEYIDLYLVKEIRELCGEMEQFEDHINRDNTNKEISNHKGRQKGAKNKTAKYKLEYEGKTHKCTSQQEIANICGRSRMCISRLIRGETTFRCKERTKDLKKIKITVL